MLTALDAPYAKLDEQERKFVGGIRAHGWFATHVFSGEGKPGFSYTTGFFATIDRPELMVFSLKREIAHTMFDFLYAEFKRGATLSVATPTTDVFINGRAAFLEVDERHYDEHFGWTKWFYAGQIVPVRQIVWTDKADRFPWEVGFDQSFRDDQVDLSRHGWSEPPKG
jgi:Domain of unknown function (DUF4262)